MSIEKKLPLQPEEKERLISMITPELSTLRTKVGFSQEELSNFIGVSRQTYGAIERGGQRLTWNTYLSLILLYDYNDKTHELIHSLGIFPDELLTRLNGGKPVTELNVNDLVGGGMQSIVEGLDDRALDSIKSMVMVEYARCAGISSEAIVKSFDGIVLSKRAPSVNDAAAAKALKAIKRRRNGQK